MTGHAEKRNISRGRGLRAGTERGKEILFYLEGSGKQPMVVGVLEGLRHVVPCLGLQWEPELCLDLGSCPVEGVRDLRNCSWQKELRDQVWLRNKGPVGGRTVLNVHHGVDHSGCPQSPPQGPLLSPGKGAAIISKVRNPRCRARRHCSV